MMEFPLVWDSTRVSALRACRKQFEYGHLSNLKLKGQSIHLHAGAAFARGLEVARLAYYADGKSAADAVDLGVHALILAYGDFDDGGATKSCDRMAGALEYYFSQYPLDADPARIITIAGRPAVEFSFAIPLPISHPDTGEPLLFCGRFDAVVEFAGGIYPNDEKTTSSLGSSWSKQWEMRGQFFGYSWALREHGISPAGMIISGISILKTKYECQRAVVPTPNWRINDWLDDTLAEIQAAKDLWIAKGKWRRNWSESCNSYGSCSYKQLCTIEDPAPWIEMYYEKNEWSPLKVIEGI